MINPIVEAALKVVGGMSLHGYVHEVSEEHVEAAKTELRNLCEEWEQYRMKVYGKNTSKDT